MRRWALLVACTALGGAACADIIGLRDNSFVEEPSALGDVEDGRTGTTWVDAGGATPDAVSSTPLDPCPPNADAADTSCGCVRGSPAYFTKLTTNLSIESTLVARDGAVYWSVRGALYRASAAGDGSDASLLVAVPSGRRITSFDVSAGQVFWINGASSGSGTDEIARCPVANCSLPTIMATRLSRPSRLIVRGSQVLFADTTYVGVMPADTEASDAGPSWTRVGSPSQPNGLQGDVSDAYFVAGGAGKKLHLADGGVTSVRDAAPLLTVLLPQGSDLFWSEGQGVGRSPRQGGPDHLLVPAGVDAGGVFLAGELAASPSHLYYLDGREQVIGCVPRDGSAKAVNVVTGERSRQDILHLATTDDALFWIDNNKIGRMRR